MNDNLLNFVKLCSLCISLYLLTLYLPSTKFEHKNSPNHGMRRRSPQIVVDDNVGVNDRDQNGVLNVRSPNEINLQILTNTDVDNHNVHLREEYPPKMFEDGSMVTLLKDLVGHNTNLPNHDLCVLLVTFRKMNEEMTNHFHRIIDWNLYEMNNNTSALEFDQELQTINLFSNKLSLLISLEKNLLDVLEMRAKSQGFYDSIKKSEFPTRKVGKNQTGENVKRDLIDYCESFEEGQKLQEAEKLLSQLYDMDRRVKRIEERIGDFRNETQPVEPEHRKIEKELKKAKKPKKQRKQKNKKKKHRKFEPTKPLNSTWSYSNVTSGNTSFTSDNQTIKWMDNNVFGNYTWSNETTKLQNFSLTASKLFTLWSPINATLNQINLNDTQILVKDKAMMKSEDGALSIDGSEILNKDILNGNKNATARSEDGALAVNGTIKILDKRLLDINNNTGLRGEDGALYVNGTIKILEKEIKAAKDLLHSLNDGNGIENPIQAEHRNLTRENDNQTNAFGSGSGNSVPTDNEAQIDVGPMGNDSHLGSQGDKNAIRHGENNPQRMQSDGEENIENNTNDITNSNRTNNRNVLASPQENTSLSAEFPNFNTSNMNDSKLINSNLSSPEIPGEKETEQVNIQQGLPSESEEDVVNNTTSTENNNNTVKETVPKVLHTKPSSIANSLPNSIKTPLNKSPFEKSSTKNNLFFDHHQIKHQNLTSKKGSTFWNNHRSKKSMTPFLRNFRKSRMERKRKARSKNATKRSGTKGMIFKIRL
ncbi:putative uncharacterized protein DDB_G0282133 [Clytia hemisphaerica]|uniref:Uncharacterized protein n=1 Tax=Clytia hemisphaerica TaxID=252671 RepID=A0A7M5XLN0_9CNID